MEKIEIVKYLLGEIEQEQDQFKRYEVEKQRAKKESDKTGKHIWNCEKWNEPFPSKTRIKENCKIIRRMILEIAKEG